MDYGIALCFDKDTELYFNSIMAAISDETASAEKRTSPSFPPHITLACFSAESIDPIIKELGRYASGLKASDMTWVSLGAFVPSVLFAAPVINDYLLSANAALSRLLEPFALHGHYLPNKWVPHTTLAVNLSHDELVKAFDIASQQFNFFAGKCNRLLFAECEPYKKVAVWDLF